MGCRMLLVGFRHTSAEQLIAASHDCDTLLLPNDKQKDAELLTRKLSNVSYDFVICTGQRPNIKDKIHIETTADENNSILKTVVDCQKLAELFRQYGIQAKLSHNAGSSFCNALYFSGLRFIKEHNLRTGLVFVHVPYQKNMSSPDIFQKCFIDVVDVLKMMGVEDLWKK